MTKEDHIAYVEDLKKLADVRGKAISGYALQQVKKLAEVSKGKPDAFVKLVGAYRKQIVAQMVRGAMVSRTKAVELGKGLAEKK